jgi:hypothetical protein
MANKISLENAVVDDPEFQYKESTYSVEQDLFRRSEHQNRENVLAWEITVPDWPTDGLYSHPSLEIPLLHHPDISLSGFCVNSF